MTTLSTTFGAVGSTALVVDSSKGTAVSGRSTIDDYGTGVEGWGAVTPSSSSVGVYGDGDYGTWGNGSWGAIGTAAATGVGAYGSASDAQVYPPGAAGVVGQADTGAGVVGFAGTVTPDSIPENTGVYGAASAYAVLGIGSASGYGVTGVSANAVGVRGVSTYDAGVYGTSTNFDGVLGYSAAHYGVEGRSDSSIGVRGLSGTGNGVVATSDSGIGVYAASGTGTALSVVGPAVFDRSGVATVPSGQSLVTVTVPGVALTASSFVVATLQRADGSAAVLEAAVPAVGGHTITIYLTKSVVAATKVAWLVLG